MQRNGRTAVIGVGNPLMADDGLGLAALARLADDYELGADVDLVDGGTWGLNLLPVLEESEAVLFIDAIEARQTPGELIVVERDDLPRVLEATKASPHQIDLKDILALAELRGTLPERVVAIGLQPARVEMSTSLSPALEAGIERVLEAIAERLAAWGVECRRRSANVHA